MHHTCRRRTCHRCLHRGFQGWVSRAGSSAWYTYDLTVLGIDYLTAESLAGLSVEDRAALIVDHAFAEIAVVRRDDGRAAAAHDFDLVHPLAGLVGAMEVTEVTIEPLRRAAAAMERHFPDHVMPATELRHKWHVYPSHRTHFKGLESVLPGLLREVEDAGLDQFFWATDAHQWPAVMQLWRDLGIEFGRRWSRSADAKVILSKPGDRSVWEESAGGPASYLQLAVEQEASKKDNIHKLEASGARRRHLFLWVDADCYRPWKDLVVGERPVSDPILPGAVTDVWTATIGPDATLIVWRFHADAGWE